MRNNLSENNRKKSTGLDEASRINIDELKAEFESEGESYTVGELEKIRDFFYLLAQISYELYQRNIQLSEAKIINIKNYQTDEQAKSNIIYPCEYGRTG